MSLPGTDPRSPLSLPQRLRSRLRQSALTGPLLLALLALGSAWLFVELVDEVLEDGQPTIDRWLLLALRDPDDLAEPIGPWWFDLMMSDLTALGSLAVLTLVGLAAISHLLVLRRWGMALLVAISVGGGMLLTHLLKHFIERPRPDVVPHTVEVMTLSFPSGHATMSAVVYLTLGALLASLQQQRRARLHLLAVAALLTALVGASRVYLGVHWPSDVLAGWALGTAWALLCLLVAQWLHARGMRDPDPAQRD